MDTASHLESLARDGRMVGGIAAGDLDRPVPSCPGWAVADLVTHLTGVHRWVSAVLASGGPVRWSDLPPAPEGRGDALMQWYREGLDQLLADLSARSPADEAWTFSPAGVRTVGWWARRQALETAVHRVDAEISLGRQPGAIPAELAVDGIDETFSDFLPRVLARSPVEGLHGSLHVHATDAAGEWWLDLDDTPPRVRREHAKADAAVRGPASGLYLWLWNRARPVDTGLEVFGDTTLVEAWQGVRF